MELTINPHEIRWNLEKPVDAISSLDQVSSASDMVISEIRELRREFGRELVLLGHHYQRDQVIQFADLIEDSLALSRYAAEMDEARYVIFLGIHIMAETADMLTSDAVTVILPDIEAGCTMGDWAPLDKVEASWNEMTGVTGEQNIMPVSYINSTAAVKAFAGKHGGVSCTSANTSIVIKWALEQREKILFLPDKNLGGNAAFALGIPFDQMVIWDPDQPLGGHSEKAIDETRVILWKGCCSVHEHFYPEHVQYWRSKYDDIRIIVHPECSWELTGMADDYGSTSQIIRKIRESQPGSRWAVGTEYHMVKRLCDEMANHGKYVYNLAPYACMCSTMFRITPEALLDSLRALKQGEYRWAVRVDKDTAAFAGEGLRKMLEITSG